MCTRIKLHGIMKQWLSKAANEPGGAHDRLIGHICAVYREALDEEEDIARLHLISLATMYDKLHKKSIAEELEDLL